MPNTIHVPSAEDWKRALDALPDLICTLDPAHKVRWMNAAMAKKLGVTQAEATGLTCYEAVHGTTCPPDCCPHRQLLQDQQEHAVEIHEERLGGDFLVTCTPMRDQGGQLVGSLHVARDITERKRAADTLRQRVDELASLNAFSRSINTSLSLEQTVSTALEGLVKVIRPDQAFLFLREGDSLVLFDSLPEAVRDRLGEFPEHRVGECLCGLAVHERKPIFSVNIFEDRCCTWQECKKAGIRSFAALPLCSGEDEAIGVIGLVSKTERDFEQQGSYLETLAAQVSIALANARLHESLMLELVERRQAQEALRLFKESVDNSADAVGMSTPAGKHYYQNKVFDEWFGEIGENPPETLFVDHGVGHEVFRAIMAGGQWTGEVQMYGRDRSILTILLRAYASKDKTGRITALIGVHTDITEHKRAEEERESLRKTAEALAEVFLGLGREPQQNMDRIVRAAGELTGSAAALYNRLDDKGCSLEIWSSHQLPPDMPRADTPQGHICYEATIRGRDHTIILGNLENTDYERTDPAVGRYGLKAYLGHPIHLRGVAIGALAVVDSRPRSFTPGEIGAMQMLAKALSLEEERHLAEQELKQNEERFRDQLSQAQKMESVGRLAGGVAHDFNNMLGVILGYAQLAMLKIGPDEPLYADLDEIRRAGERSADLTRQLLAFARKQTVAPKVLDLNETVEGMLKMLRRLIGEDMDLAWRPGSTLGPVFIDPSQVDQILANLCINARDAIADTGKITIETASVSFDEAYCAYHAGFVPGEFVMLAVSDDGCGMDAEILDHLFEPFFSTKEMGKGTGLGLATVYGIVKQNNGFINVYSEPGHGTTFKIYLPQQAAKAAPRSEQEQAPAPAAGSETILLVEDEPAILKVTTLMLEIMGYAVIAAGSPGEAIHLAREHLGRIDLLMTDVVMPEMNGRDLARNLLSIYPDIRRLFMSGYTANVIAHHGVLDQGVHFLQKPFSIQDLAAKIREALDREESARAND